MTTMSKLENCILWNPYSFSIRLLARTVRRIFTLRVPFIQHMC